jgi:hypothetical protein
MRMQAIGAILAAGTFFANPAVAACPQELAVYESADGNTALEFVGRGDAVMMAHEVRLIFRDGPVMTGYVAATHGLRQPEIVTPHNCPEGDVTGEELDACLLYRSVVYGTDETGQLIELPVAGEDAARQILLPNLAAMLWMHPAFDGEGPTHRPAEILELSGCQE